MFHKYSLIKLAAQKIIDQNFLIFDTETTGLEIDDEIIELGIIDCQGNELYNSLFRPSKDVPGEVIAVSGITNEMLENQPRFQDEYEKIVNIMNGKGVIAFNEEFDERLFYQTVQKYNLDSAPLDNIFSKAYCAQNLYDCYIGYDRTKLEYACAVEGVQAIQDHRAVGDCQMTLEMIKSVANCSKVPNLQLYGETKAKATGKSLEEVMNNKVIGMKEKYYDPAYVELFKQGKSIQEIVQTKRVLSKTVEDALIQAFSSGELNDIDSLIQVQYVKDILKVISRPDWNGRLTPVKDVLPKDCTWICIRAVIAKNKKGLYAKECSEIQKPLDDVISKAMDLQNKRNANNKDQIERE